jgi:hypothetical protein
MLAGEHAEENGAHTPPRNPAVFLAHASPPSRNAADSELMISALVGSRRNRRVRGGEGFNRRGSISVLRFNAQDFTPLGAPKLSAGAAGIESVLIPKGSLWDDFDRFLLSQSEGPLRGGSSAFCRGYFSQRDPFGTFLDRK